jgi:two-component system cell cycle sensor histidine kinase/response regulator CckA
MAVRASVAERRRDRTRRGWPLRAYLGVLLALFLVTALMSIAFVRGPQDRNATRLAQQDAQFSASLAAGGVSTAVAQLQSAVSRIATLPAVAVSFDRPDCAISADVIGPFGTPRFDLVRADGSVVCSSAPVAGARPTWQVDSTKATPLTLLTDPVSRRLSAVSVAPVAGRGAVVATVDLTGLGPALSSRFAGPQNVELLIVSPDGTTVIARSLEATRWVGASVNETPFAAIADPVTRPGVDGVTRIYGSATVTGAGWIVYAGVDRDAALAVSREVARQQVGVTLVGMLVLLVGTLVLYRLITKPLRRLDEAMGQGTSGFVRGPVPPSGPTEIAALADRFNALVAAVRSEIAERGHAEEIAHASEKNYRLLFEGNPQPIFVYDLDTLAFLEVNEGAIRRYGYTRDEFRSKTIPDILTNDTIPLLSTVKTNPDLHPSGPWKHRLKDGTLIDVETTSIGLRYDGHDSRMVVVQDLTEQKKLEGQLQQSQRLETVGQLAGGIAHDFNNLLAVILNYADFVAEELPEGQLKEDVAEIERAATRAADLTRQLLIFARREVANPQVLDVNTVVTGVEKLLRRTLGEDVKLDLSLAEALPAVRADAGQLEQVFLNLAVNARDAMPGGGHLVVETSCVEVDDVYVMTHPTVLPGRYLRLSVSDTGIGMTQDVVRRAFEPFFTTKPAGQGTGLGLATVYGIVKQAGGNIDLYSEPGLGTRVSIQLPAIDEPASVVVQPAAPEIELGRGRTVLLVEDESAVLFAAARILGAQGYTVLVRADPNDALKAIADAETPIDILVTDVVMPGLSGIDLARRARELRPGLPVLYTSGYSEELVVRRGAIPAGCSVVQKPFTRQGLLEAVGKALGTIDAHA